MLIGVISDTHGLVRPEAVAALAGSDLILHAGDIGKREVLNALQRIAPVLAVRGNVDPPGWRDIPLTQVVEAGPFVLYMLHNLDHLDLVPEAAGVAAVIYGHSHKPSSSWRNGVLYFNPGSAGRRRFRLPISLGLLRIASGTLHPELITLTPGP